MRIMLAPSAFHPSRGGVEELTLQLAKDYQHRGHDVTVVVNQHPADLPASDVVEAVQVRRLPFALPGFNPRRLVRYPSYLRSLLGQLDQLGPVPDVVHVQCASSQVVPLALWSARRQVPLIVTTQGEVTMDAGRVYQQSAQMRMSLRFGSRRASVLTACSRRAADDAAGVAQSFQGCRVIPNGVDPTQWKVTPLPAQPTYAAWGRHVPQKGLDLLIQAFSLVRKQLPCAVLRIGGDGPELERLKALAGPGVEFLGTLDRAAVQALMDRSRVAIVPSRLEPFGIVAVEAMACGRGVVWSTNGGLEDATAGLGWGVDPRDPQALAKAMVQAYENPVDPAAARAHAESLSWQHIGDQYLDIYKTTRWRAPSEQRS
ncbi:glycosyltransferase family 4 protein [Ornithinimicrobium cerasi]|uniref:D-inositol 3-phosphate glycosyltransferase n=1 Tax=Ornithinimicrobium cerasi TaxID=2248773 RepID=A0A285VUV0_9MICO|nr:glycosyltransferase family 4 protein [Ornithinimicrobium cerasi]SOC57814.1 Phosphatidylinositol alpha-mannosyltransferase [Ornithinimicrobium cerasi]